MNQIIYDMNKNKQYKVNNNFFKFFFSFCIIVLLFFTLWILYRFYKSNQNNTISQKLITSYSISTLYSNTTSYETKIQNESNPFVIRNYKNR